jgi:hypothetical protein
MQDGSATRVNGLAQSSGHIDGQGLRDLIG